MNWFVNGKRYNAALRDSEVLRQTIEKLQVDIQQSQESQQKSEIRADHAVRQALEADSRAASSLIRMSKFHKMELLARIGGEDKSWTYLKNLASLSPSQLGADLVCASLSNFKENGFFVEFGATDGLTISNTFLLEKHYGWKGILVEPNRAFHPALKLNRNCVLDFRCVWIRDGDEVDFVDVGELSTLQAYKNNDVLGSLRESDDSFSARTVTLNTLLAEHGAPKFIDYLSIDTEGSELDLLLAFDFNEYSFGFVSIEHNFGELRTPLHALMTSKGYSRILYEESNWDDWYVPSSQEKDLEHQHLMP